MRNYYLLFAAVFALSFTSCDVDQTREGELPAVDVDVETEPGQMPAYDVDWADVDVTTRTKMVQVPKVRVVMEEEAIEVPVVDVDWPGDDEVEEMALMVEADVNQDASLEIEEVFTNGDRIVVLATLDKDGEMLEDGEMMRVSDQIYVNAPDLDVRYYIIGDRPDGMTNTRYRYISNRSKIDDIVKGNQSIYSRTK